MHTYTAIRFVIVIVALMLSASFLISMAQDNGLNLIQTAEYNIGFKCPVTSALDPSGETVWVLMNNCAQSGFTLHVYNIADGSQINEEDYAETLAALSSSDLFVDPFIAPMAFTPDGDLSIRYSDMQTDASLNLIIPLDGGEATVQTDETYDAFLAGYSDYPTFSVYSPDHTRVLASGETSAYVLDVQTQTEIAEIPTDGFSLALFSSDGERVEVTRFDNPDDPDDLASTLLIYSLPDGDLLHEYQVPSPALWVSPDGKYAAVNLYSNNIGDRNELVVVDLETGLTSSPSNLNEDPAPVTTCLNTGNNVSDVGFMTDGQFSIPSLHWTPDSSGIVLPLSFGGEAAQSGSNVCFFNYSRLRVYQVETAD